MLSFSTLRALAAPLLAAAAVTLTPAAQAEAQHGYSTCPATGQTIIINPAQPNYRPGPIIIQQPVYRGHGFRPFHHRRGFARGFHHRRHHFNRGFAHGHHFGHHRSGFRGTAIGVNTGDFGFFLRTR